MNAIVRLALAALLFVPTVAEAHTGLGDGGGLAHGLAHPLSGLDHVLAMVAVGLLAARFGGRALLVVPAAFVGVMTLGGGLAMAGVGLPFVETGIAVSVVVLGVAVALERPWPVGVAAGLAGLAAMFHGHAHGAEMPVDGSGLAYAAGFVLATAGLHAAGIGLGLVIGRSRLLRAGGIAMALAGAGLLTATL